MTVGGINGNTGAGAGAAGMGHPGTDAYGRNLQRQIADAQKELQTLAGNQDVDPDAKAKKRQEIQKRISDLNAQLRRHQAEERRKAQQEKQQNVRQEERPGKSGEVGNVIDERL